MISDTGPGLSSATIAVTFSITLSHRRHFWTNNSSSVCVKQVVASAAKSPHDLRRVIYVHSRPWETFAITYQIQTVMQHSSQLFFQFSSVWISSKQLLWPVSSFLFSWSIFQDYLIWPADIFGACLQESRYHFHYACLLGKQAWYRCGDARYYTSSQICEPIPMLL